MTMRRAMSFSGSPAVPAEFAARAGCSPSRLVQSEPDPTPERLHRLDWQGSVRRRTRSTSVSPSSEPWNSRSNPSTSDALGAARDWNRNVSPYHSTPNSIHASFSIREKSLTVVGRHVGGARFSNLGAAVGRRRRTGASAGCRGHGDRAKGPRDRARVGRRGSPASGTLRASTSVNRQT